MAVAFNWQNTQNNSFLASTTSINVGSTNALGANGTFVSGDYLIALVVAQAASQTFTMSGWTQLATVNDTTNGYTAAIFGHACTGGETGSFPVSWGTSAFPFWTLASFTGASGTEPDAHVQSTYTSGGGTTVTTSTITPVASTSLAYLCVYNIDGTALTVPADMTSAYNVLIQSSSTTNFGSYKSVTGTTGFTETFTASTTFRQGTYFLMTLAPAAAGDTLFGGGLHFI